MNNHTQLLKELASKLESYITKNLPGSTVHQITFQEEGSYAEVVLRRGNTYQATTYRVDNLENAMLGKIGFSPLSYWTEGQI